MSVTVGSGIGSLEKHIIAFEIPSALTFCSLTNDGPKENQDYQNAFNAASADCRSVGLN